MSVIFVWFMLYSFLGWLYESCLYTLITGKPINTGFLYGPFCPIYGIGSLIGIALFFNRVNSALGIFFMAFLIEGTFEFIVGTILENCFHKKWWDYSDLRFNIKGRVCLLSSSFFGLMIILLVKFIHSFVVFVTYFIPQRVMSLAAVFLLYIFIRDIVFTVAQQTECKNNFLKYQKMCLRIMKKDEMLKNGIYSLLTSSRILNSIIKKAEKITDKLSLEDVSREYVKLRAEDFEALKENIMSKIGKR